MGKKSMFGGIYFGQDNKESFKKTFEMLTKDLNISKRINLEKYGKAGVEALKAATPVDTGKTRDSWYYQIFTDKGEISIKFYNSNINDGTNIALLIQYGHLTGDGYYVKGVDYINPSLKPIFNDIAENVWKEVTSE